MKENKTASSHGGGRSRGVAKAAAAPSVQRKATGKAAAQPSKVKSQQQTTTTSSTRRKGEHARAPPHAPKPTMPTLNTQHQMAARPTTCEPGVCKGLACTCESSKTGACNCLRRSMPDSKPPLFSTSRPALSPRSINLTSSLSEDSKALMCSDVKSRLTPLAPPADDELCLDDWFENTPYLSPFSPIQPAGAAAAVSSTMYPHPVPVDTTETQSATQPEMLKEGKIEASYQIDEASQPCTFAPNGVGITAYLRLLLSPSDEARKRSRSCTPTTTASNKTLRCPTPSCYFI
jgi:hypothetical protein